MIWQFYQDINFSRSNACCLLTGNRVFGFGILRMFEHRKFRSSLSSKIPTSSSNSCSKTGFGFRKRGFIHGLLLSLIFSHSCFLKGSHPQLIEAQKYNSVLRSCYSSAELLHCVRYTYFFRYCCILKVKLVFREIHRLFWQNMRRKGHFTPIWLIAIIKMPIFR